MSILCNRTIYVTDIDSDSDNMSNLGNNVRHEVKGNVLTRKLSSKDNEPSPNPDKKFNSTNGKSNIPKSVTQIKTINNPHNRPQSSYAVAKDRDSDSNPESKSSSKTTSRYAKSKTPLGNSSKTSVKRSEITGGQRSRHSIQHLSDSKRGDPSDDLVKSGSPTSSCDSCPSSPTSSPKLDASLDASDEPFLPEFKPNDIVKPPFIISKAEPDENLELPPSSHEGKCSRQCSHSHLLAFKSRVPKKRTGQLRNMKTQSSKRIDTLNDYLSIYEERLGRANNDYSFLMKDVQLKCDEMICQITARWEALKGQIEQEYESLIQGAESHRNNIAQELSSHENLQNDSSTLYDICDLEEDNQNLTSWVNNLRERYSDVLSNSHNRNAMEFISEFSIDSIEGIRENIEGQVSQLFKNIPKLSIDPPLTSGIDPQINNANSLNTDIEYHRNSHTENPNSNVENLRNSDYPQNSNTDKDNPRFSKPHKLRTSNL